MYANVKIVVLYLKITVSLLLLCRPSVLYVNKATCPPYFSCGLFLVRRVSYYTGNALLCGVELFLLLIVSRSNTKVHLSADACSLDWPGGTPGNY